jgi:type IV secretory pathway VirB10-like protein
MNTFWLKIAALLIAVVAGIIVIGSFTGGDSEPKEPEETFYDKVEEDKQRFLTEPQPVQAQETEPVAEQGPAADDHHAVVPVPPAPRPVEPPKPTILYFKDLSEMDKIEAERLLNAAVPARSLGRLQIGFNLMMQNCRQILQRWPDSSYAYRAKKMIVDMPERFRDRYKVTKEELDLGIFAESRPGTRPFTVEELN